MTIDWVFPSSNGGSDDGFNDAGIETFAGDRFNSLAREIIQNSLDAMSDDSDQVTVEFDFFEIASEALPGRDSLLKEMELCLKESKGDKERSFFENAVQKLQEEKIPCLKIQDSGTTGLQGDYRSREGQWYAITKGRGVSDKGQNTIAGGSFGIGKNAPFTVSFLRTVFYSTLYTENKKDVFRAQGKSILMSHSTSDGGYTQATGFYGEQHKCYPIEVNIPEILRPKEQGCIVFIPGFDVTSNWGDIITATVVANFFYAIDQGKLQVLIQDKNNEPTVIDKDQLEECFTKIKKLDIFPNKIKKSWHYYQAIKSEGSDKDSELPLLGHCKMWVKIGEKLPKRVALLRKTGMLITDDQKGLKRWPGRSDFVGVFLCDSDKGNQKLRAMENPQHNAFEPDRTSGDESYKNKKALKELCDWVRGVVDEMAKSEEGEISQIDELNQFFPDTDEPESIPGDEGERDIEGMLTYSPKPIKRPKSQVDLVEDEEGGDGGGYERNSGGKRGKGGQSDGTGEGAGSGGTGSRSSRQSIEIQNARVVSDGTNKKVKTIYFTAKESGKIQIKLGVMGDNGGTEIIPIVKANGLSDGIIHTTVKSDERISLEVTLANAISDSIAVLVSKEQEKISNDETITK